LLMVVFSLLVPSMCWPTCVASSILLIQCPCRAGRLLVMPDLD
jgi:hypothetical protein